MHFHYSSYWCSWSRVISTSCPKGPYVEVDLTPIPSHRDTEAKEWERIGNVWIRVHGTAPKRTDKNSDILPYDVMRKMEINIGQEKMQRLLTEDFLSQIDWLKYEKVCNGGAALKDILR